MASPSSWCSVLLLTGFLVSGLQAVELETDSLLLTVESRCAEGNVTCDKMTLQAIHKITGASILLAGETMHTLCADRVTPCQFIGYRFRHGDLEYQLTEAGVLAVFQNNQVIFEEAGSWQY